MSDSTLVSFDTETTQNQKRQEEDDATTSEPAVDANGNANAAVAKTTVAKRRRRALAHGHLAVSTIDEILRRQDSSLQQYYQDTMRQVNQLTYWRATAML